MTGTRQRSRPAALIRPEDTMPASAQPRTIRASGAPAYYLGRPASWWITATTRRVRVPDTADETARPPSTQETR